MKEQEQWKEVTVAVPAEAKLTPEQWKALIEAITTAVPAIIALIVQIIGLFSKKGGE